MGERWECWEMKERDGVEGSGVDGMEEGRGREMRMKRGSAKWRERERER